MSNSVTSSSFLLSILPLRTLSFDGMWFAIAAANMIAKRIWAVTHAMATPTILVSTTSALAALPSSVQLLKSTSSGGAVRRCQAAACCAGVGIVDILCVVVLNIVAGHLRASG
ncbi:hypothetical protein V8F33_002390 [Rhypophila sp. PSN 637]